jgi:sulfite reductase (NADPH) flavoprotein alpha-component
VSTAAHAPVRLNRAMLGNRLLGLALLAGAVVLLPLQRGDWWIAIPGRERWLAAGALLLAYAGFCGWIAWRSRSRRASSAAGDDARARVLVAYASQTGFAQQLAERTADTLAQARVAVDLRSLSQLDAASLAAYARALFIASTTGEGDPPDHVLAFVHDVLGAQPSLPVLRYGVLALGDREYANFCGFGHALDLRLRHAGASPLFDLIEVDNGDPGALRHWQHHLGLLAEVSDLPDWEAPRYSRWRVAERVHLNPGSTGGPCFHLALQPMDTALPRWQAGDIAEIGPRHASQTVDRFLAGSGLAGDTRVVFANEACALADALSRSRLPAPESVRDLSASRVLDRLVARRWRDRIAVAPDASPRRPVRPG